MPQHAGVLPSSNGPAAPDAVQKSGARIELRLTIPKRPPHAHYVSPNTLSIVVTEGKTKLGTFNTTPTSKGCTTPYGSTVCTFKTGLVSGKNKTIAVSAYDATGGTGKLLSTGMLTTKIVAGLNILPITLSGVVKSVAIALQNPNSPAGTAVGAPGLAITVMAKDADGNTIVGPGTYSTPITLTDSDASGVTSILGATVTSPNDRPALTYSGASLTSATIGASGISGVTTATFAPMPTVVGDFILPTTIGSATDLSVEPIAITNGPDGNLWMSAFDNTTHHAIMVMSPSGTFLTTWVPGSAPSTNLPEDSFHGMTVGSDRHIWYVGQNNVGNITTAGVTTNYLLTGIPGICASPIGTRIAPAADGGLWFTIACVAAPSQLVHVTTSGVFKVNALPANVSLAFGVVAATDGNVYVGVTDNSIVGAIMRATVAGDTVTATDLIDVPNSGPFITGVAQSADGDLWATNSGCSTSLVVRVHLASGFAPSSMASFPTLSGCEQPAYLVGLPDDSLWVPEGGTATITQVTLNGQGPPAMFDLPFKSPHSITGEAYDAAIGANGNIFVTDFDQNKAGFSSNVLEVAY